MWTRWSFDRELAAPLQLCGVERALRARRQDQAVLQREGVARGFLGAETQVPFEGLGGRRARPMPALAGPTSAKSSFILLRARS